MSMIALRLGIARCAAMLTAAFLYSPAHAHDPIADSHKALRADSHAPLGVMGDHTHSQGEVMFSYRFMHMNMAGNRIGTDDVSPEQIVTTVPNTFAGTAGQPNTLRIVPTEMTMNMHMFGAMYAPADWLTLMAMTGKVSKEMDHITFQGGAGTNRLGTFTTKTEGLGDSSLSGLFSVLDTGSHTVHGTLGLSLPTGSTSERGTILTPMGTRQDVKLPYPMQLGSGTFDPILGVTYNGRSERFSWGAQYRGKLRVHDNADDYRLGDEHRMTAWGAVLLDDWVSTSLRIEGRTLGDIDGQDSEIIGPVQTANTNFHGGERIDLSLGANFALPLGDGNVRFAVEGGAPVYQNLNGPQMETDWNIVSGLQVAF